MTVSWRWCHRVLLCYTAVWARNHAIRIEMWDWAFWTIIRMGLNQLQYQLSCTEHCWPYHKLHRIFPDQSLVAALGYRAMLSVTQQEWYTSLNISIKDDQLDNYDRIWTECYKAETFYLHFYNKPLSCSPDFVVGWGGSAEGANVQEWAWFSVQDWLGKRLCVCVWLQIWNVATLFFFLQPSIALPNYQTGLLSNSPKMAVMMELINRSVMLGDRVLVFRCVIVYVSMCREGGEKEVGGDQVTCIWSLRSPIFLNAHMHTHTPTHTPTHSHTTYVHTSHMQSESPYSLLCGEAALSESPSHSPLWWHSPALK